MHFSAVTGCLALLLATLVVVTTSLPQSPSSPQDGVSRLKNHPFYYQPPKGCLGIGATKYKHDIELKLVKRGSHSNNLPCGRVVTGGQSDPFGFPSYVSQAMLLWNFGGQGPGRRIVSLMRVNRDGPDFVVRQAWAHDYRVLDFIPLAGALYYITLSGRLAAEMAWFFEYVYAYSVTFCSGVLANQVEQTVMIDSPGLTEAEPKNQRARWIG